jgi:hypothetical protein
MGHTQGMCGTFDHNQNNDLTTRDHLLETNPNRFGNTWKTQASCRDVPDQLPPNPCDTDPIKKQQATDQCNKLKSDVFRRMLWATFVLRMYHPRVMPKHFWSFYVYIMTMLQNSELWGPFPFASVIYHS